VLVIAVCASRESAHHDVTGAKKVEGITVDIYQVQETLNDEVLGKMHAPPKVENTRVT
jgi:hypothetical protein